MIENEFAKIHKLYIADGHHRAKSASRAREEKKKANPIITEVKSIIILLL